MKLLGLKLVGRNHYDPESAIVLEKHRLVLNYILKSKDICLLLSSILYPACRLFFLQAASVAGLLHQY